MTLKLDFAFLSPVQVVKVTTQNLQEVAEWCGGQVASTESRRVPGRQDSYVWVPTPKGTAISWAFPGMFITKRLVRTIKDELRVTYAVFRRDYYEKNYFETPNIAVAQTWEKGMKTPNTPKKSPKPTDHKHPQMAGKPSSLELNVSVPPGSTVQEVEGAIVEAVKVLQETGVLPEGPLLTEDPGVKLVQDIVDKKAALDVALDASGTTEAVVANNEAIAGAALEAIANADNPDHTTKVEHGVLTVGPQPFTGVPPGSPKMSDLMARTPSPREVHDRQIAQASPEVPQSDPGTPETEEDGDIRELVPDHELRVMGLPTSYQEGYKPVYRDEVPTDVSFPEN